MSSTTWSNFLEWAIKFHLLALFAAVVTLMVALVSGPEMSRRKIAAISLPIVVLTVLVLLLLWLWFIHRFERDFVW